MPLAVRRDTRAASVSDPGRLLTLLLLLLTQIPVFASSRNPFDVATPNVHEPLTPVSNYPIGEEVPLDTLARYAMRLNTPETHKHTHRTHLVQALRSSQAESHRTAGKKRALLRSPPQPRCGFVDSSTHHNAPQQATNKAREDTRERDQRAQRYENNRQSNKAPKQQSCCSGITLLEPTRAVDRGVVVFPRECTWTERHKPARTKSVPEVEEGAVVVVWGVVLVHVEVPAKRKARVHHRVENKTESCRWLLFDSRPTHFRNKNKKYILV